ncbi:hypothetical protein A8B78_02010 [Jannaschia sp. EhC01]|nr:hypothetical protein A8B78_02010 [Jannaschia sp. EhC01]
MGFSAICLWAAWDIPTGRTMVGPRSVPAIAAGFIGLGGLAILLSPLLGRAPGIGIGKPHRVLAIVLPAAVLAMFAVWLWGAVGWTLAALMVAPAFFAIFGARGWRELILFPSALVGILYLIFFQLLGLWHGTGWLIRAMGLS